MKDRSRVIFGNEISARTIKKAEKSKKKYQKKFKMENEIECFWKLEENDCLGEMLGIENMVLCEEDEQSQWNDKGLIVGNIRMGFGHYRIAMAIASAANAMGYKPYWMDLASYPKTLTSKIIQYQNELYSTGSRISSKSKLFNHFVWEPMNYEGFRKLSYNATDQKNAELMAPLFLHIPKKMPFVATHVWPSQAAIHGDMEQVVNAIPDNWPMALHLSQGSIHTVQTHSSYFGYRMLNGMSKKILKPMENKDLQYTGHYVDHELVYHLNEDCAMRISRANEDKPLRILMTIGGAGAQREMFCTIIRSLLPKVKTGKVVLIINVGDYKNVWEKLQEAIPELKKEAVFLDNDWEKTRFFAESLLSETTLINGIYGIYHADLFQAVYATNLLMRGIDLMVTKPSELAFYPVPKLFIQRVGGHEKWGAIHGAEIGDGTIECEKVEEIIQLLDLLENDRKMIINMCECIIENKKNGIYDGAYKVVELATGTKREGN